MSVKESQYKREVALLKHQLDIVSAQLDGVTGSRGYRLVRIIGKIKNEFIKSPGGFAKKAIRRTLIHPRRTSFQGLNRKLSGNERVQAQYAQWQMFSEPDAVDLDAQRRQSDTLAYKPLISIITPVFNPPADVFEELIKSVLSQTYPHFELCLGDFGDDKAVEAVIRRYAQRDKRVRHLEYRENQGIAANSNKIFEQVHGDYIALLDHDDTLSPDALFENAKSINNTGAEFIFSDKDKIDPKGNRFEPFFKQGWSPEIMLNANYLTHLNVIKTALVREVGGWNTQTDGAQDWDLFLKTTAAANKIVHIPKVLYHWRVIPTSTAASIETKPYALAGQRKAVDLFLEKNAIPATSYHNGSELLLKWSATDPIHLVVNSTSTARTMQFLAEIQEAAKYLENVRITAIIDDDMPELPGVHVGVVPRNGSYAAALQKLLESSKDEVLFFVSDQLSAQDLRLDSLRDLAGWLHVSGVGTVFPRITDSKGEFAVDCGAVISNASIHALFVGMPGYFQAPLGNIEWVRNASIGTPLCMGIKSETLGGLLVRHHDQIAGIKELFNGELAISAIYLFAYLDGLRSVFNPKIKLRQQEGGGYDADLYYTSATELLSAYVPRFDAYYNPNVSADNPMAIAPVRHNLDIGTADLQDIGREYRDEALAHAQHYLLGEKEIFENLKHIRKGWSKALPANPSVVIFLPGFSGIYAGLNNIFCYADFLTRRGSNVAFALLVQPDELEKHKRLIVGKFPQLAGASYYAVGPGDAPDIPSHDIGICTQWATAYSLVKYNDCSRKCYFIQDKEASFYPKGTISALVDNTYLFGFYAIANTPGLLEWYKKDYGGDGVTIKSRIDLSVYEAPTELKFDPKPPYKVFFYARPNEPRNAFELGLAALKLVKAELRDDVELFAAGADWSEDDYGVEGAITNLGKIDFENLPAFYRDMDAGVMFMFSGHPGVVASELMASGCPVIVNQYNDATWNELYKNEENSLVSLPTSRVVADDIIRALTDASLRKHIIQNALNTVEDFYSDYETATEESILALQRKA